MGLSGSASDKNAMGPRFVPRRIEYEWCFLDGRPNVAWKSSIYSAVKSLAGATRDGIDKPSVKIAPY
jgi:hypothetical protein